MTFISQISSDDVACAVLVLIAIRQLMIILLPDRIAGPGGWLVNTRREEV